MLEFAKHPSNFPSHFLYLLQMATFSLSPLHWSNFQQSLCCVWCLLQWKWVGQKEEEEEEEEEVTQVSSRKMEMKNMEFSNKRNGIFKKAHKLTLLHDAQVSIIMLSTNNQLFEYTSPTSTTKKIIDQYQSRVGVNIWSSHYEKMLEELRRLEDVNTTIRREIMKRKGKELDNLNMEQLCKLEEEMLRTLSNIQDRKYRLMHIQVAVRRQKVKLLEERQKTLRENLEMEYEYNGRVVDKGSIAGGNLAYPAHPRRRRLQRGDEDEDEEENSCLTTAAMEVEDSV